MKKRLTLLLTAAALLVGCQSSQRVQIIPQPAMVKEGRGEVLLTGNNITKTIDTTLGNREAYRLTVGDGRVEIVGGGEAGIFYAMQTLDQITEENRVPEVVIEDAPRFAWRGMMLDVARHTQSKEYVKEFIDMLAMHKLNTFHWHLTDAIGWRVEIEAQPKLTQMGAFRKVKDESVPWIGFELADSDYMGERYGGYFSKEDIREIVEYAASKYITVVPEIEMPGHSGAALACYTEYACVGVKGADVYCAGNDATFEFLESIIDEIVELFPSEYIHIGGDEVGKDQWSRCPRCQARKAKEGLADEHELQSYFVKRIENYINSKGKRMIGWDEIIEGGLAPNATVMSWTGWQGGIKAAETHHDVIMCPLDYVYFDHYQGYNPFEPQAWGGYNGIRRVYDFPVIPEGIAPENVKYIKGAQANMWTETVKDTAHLEYMLLPRMAALSEALWSSDKDWERFTKKLDKQIDIYTSKGWNYAQSAMTPMVKAQNGGTVELYTELGSYPIFYTFDPTAPLESWEEYVAPIEVGSGGTLRAVAKRKGTQVGYMLTIPNLANRATGKRVTYHTPYNAQYNGGGDSCLTDNRYAIKRGDDKAWQGFQKDDMYLTVDLSQAEKISEVDLRFFQHISTTSVLLPTHISVEISADNENFREVYSSDVMQSDNPNAFVESYKIIFEPTEARYVRIRAVNPGTLYKGHPREGADAWVFIDEVSVN